MSAQPPASAEAPQAPAPPPNPIKGAPTVTPQHMRPVTPFMRPTDIAHPDYGAHESVQPVDPAVQIKDMEGQMKERDTALKDQGKMLAGVEKRLYGNLMTRVKKATDARFLAGNNTPSSWGAPNQQVVPTVPQGNLFDAQSNPMLHGLYAQARPYLMGALTRRYQYSGLQPDMEEKAWHPLVQRQLQAGPYRYDPRRDATWDALKGKAQDFGRMLIGQGSPDDLFKG